jgi:hypothetical protein
MKSAKLCIAELIVETLRENAGEYTAAQIARLIHGARGRQQMVNEVLRALVYVGWLKRTGLGGGKQVFRYRLVHGAVP